MDKTTVEPVRQFDRLNLSLVESEIDFGRTVHFTAEIDLTEIERVRARAASALRPTYTAFIAKAVALALAEFPYAGRSGCRSCPTSSRFEAPTSRSPSSAMSKDRRRSRTSRSCATCSGSRSSRSRRSCASSPMPT
jgi:hypothetical protein